VEREKQTMSTTSQRLQILRTLAMGETLTTWSAIRMFGCTTLSQRCTELRKQGWDIKSRMIKVVGGKRVALYSLPRALRARAMRA
jgi:hypothetical protein